jgi:hypothetical protein
MMTAVDDSFQLPILSAIFVPYRYSLTDFTPYTTINQAFIHRLFD